MTETPVEATDLPGADQSQKQLSSPHFDETAVATAQPVQPLSVRPVSPRLRSSSKLRFAVVVATAAIFLGVIGGLFLIAGSRALTNNEHAAEPLSTSPSAQSAASSPVPATSDKDESVTATKHESNPPRSENSFTRPRPKNRMIVAAGEGDGKPVARKVGEIKYRRPTEHP